MKKVDIGKQGKKPNFVRKRPAKVVSLAWFPKNCLRLTNPRKWIKIIASNWMFRGCG